MSVALALVTMVATLDKPATFDQHCYASLRGKPLPHGEAVLDAVQRAVASEPLSLEHLPEAARAAVRETLLANGFDSSLAASEATLEQLRRDQNAARQRVHADAAAERETLLRDGLLELGRSAEAAVASAAISWKA